LSGFTYFEAPDASAMKAALKACSEMNCIFIDMQGLSRDEMLASKLKKFGLKNVQAHVHLVLSPHYSNIKELLKRYKNSFPTSLLWTKVDEAEHYAELVNVAVRSELPVSALSFGAELQGTLLPAEESQIWRLILKHQLPEAKVVKLRV
jgi:flagellar biosynthesis protein FlhF